MKTINFLRRVPNERPSSWLSVSHVGSPAFSFQIRIFPVKEFNRDASEGISLCKRLGERNAERRWSVEKMDLAATIDGKNGECTVCERRFVIK